MSTEHEIARNDRAVRNMAARLESWGLDDAHKRAEFLLVNAFADGWRPVEPPPPLVETVRRLYVDEGMTIVEVAAALNTTAKVIYRLMTNHQIPRRTSAKRNQVGPSNHMWQGDQVGYDAVHMRLASTRGPASSHRCADCADWADEWSYNGGCPDQKRAPDTGCPYSTDAARYVPRCRSCHVAYDRTRNVLGRFAARGESMPRV